MMDDPEKIADGLTEAQRRALLAFSQSSEGFPGHYALARELGVSGRTLVSLYGLGGVNPETLELGPILVTSEYTREGTFWHIEALGLRVRQVLEARHD